MCCKCCSNHSLRRPSDDFDAQRAFRNLAESHLQVTEKVASYLADPSSKKNRLELSGWLRNHSAIIVLPTVAGGDEVSLTDANTFPECCAVARHGVFSPNWYGSGVLIHPRIVLTAAHLHRDHDVDLIAFDTLKWDEAALSNQRRAKTIPHAKFSTDHRFDLAVMILTSPVPDIVKPIPIANTQEIDAAREVILVGFGAADNMGQTKDGIKRVAGEREDNRALITSRDSLQFVAGGSGVDTCPGDSGGPAYIKVDGKLKLAGITSRGVAQPDKCGQGGFYVRVDAHLGFINQEAAGIAVFSP